MTISSTFDNAEILLQRFGFSYADIQRCADGGWLPTDILTRVEGLLDEGLTVEKYAELQKVVPLGEGRIREPALALGPSRQALKHRVGQLSIGEEG